MSGNIQRKFPAKAGNNNNVAKKGAPVVETRIKRGHQEIVTRGEKVTILWKGMEVTPETHNRPRVGKTRKDAASGAKKRNADNKASRASWQGDSKASTSNFPYNSCNGQRNRTVVTGKGNERIVLSYKLGR